MNDSKEPANKFKVYFYPSNEKHKKKMQSVRKIVNLYSNKNGRGKIAIFGQPVSISTAATSIHFIGKIYTGEALDYLYDAIKVADTMQDRSLFKQD